MKRRLMRAAMVATALLGGCTGRLAGEQRVAADDVGAAPVDAERAGVDAGTALRDAGGDVPVDRGVTRVDAGPPAPVDVGTPRRDVGTPPVDAGTPAWCARGPLAVPRAECRLAVGPSTGDPRQDCVDRINQFRRECQCLPPLQRWTDGEACAESNAMVDQQTRMAHNGFRMRTCAAGSGQNECPGWLGWGSVASAVSGCLQQMWDEGPGDFYGPPAHGHYLNMSSTRFTQVACGYFTSGGATTAVQNFQ